MGNNHLAEPSVTSYANPLACYFAATRPAFLIATLAACLLGLAGAAYSGVSFQLETALITVLLALLVHAGVNVLNDYFDALNGTDALNFDRLYPFTGGSRFIQNGVLTTTQTANFGYLLLVIAILGGMWLSWMAGAGLLLIGALGVLIGWAYSASPLRLNGRGLGELCVLAGFLGVVVGADFVQRQAFSFQPIIVGMPYALLVTNLLYINQFPDKKADAMAGKHHLVVRLPLEQAVLVYPLLASLAFAWLGFFVYAERLPMLAMLSVLPLLFSARAALLLRKYAATPAYLLSAIKLTLAAMLSHALFLTLVLLWKMP
ncbi:MAG: prenyltransferase [Methylotenera sp.]|uniref:prenyltransferase n=2 Tax=Methylotenera sp. TaxID=2051956 RepID=UPI0027306F49|nr:prenyltransferase [Methylotenera sp.]MDP1524115.1 prenyltransferase [Methylotenera sp.]